VTVPPRDDWPTAEPASAGVDRRVLDGPLTRLLARNKTRAAALVVGGRLVWERYWDGYGLASRFDTWSIGKAFTAAAAGLLEGDGALSLDDPACRFLPEWAGDGRRAITIRHLLTMTSGLALAHERFTRDPDPTAAVLAWPLAHRPGEVWCYEQATAHALAVVVARVAGRQPLDLIRERVLDAIGARGVTWARAENGDCLGWRSVHASARDLCRFGELLLRRGRWGGRAVLPEGFVARMTAVDPVTAAARVESPRDDRRRRGYGFFTFVNAGGLWPGVDRDAFAPLGAWGNACLVDPGRDFVFVRLVTPEGRVDAEGEPDEALFGNALDVTDHGTARMWRGVHRAFEPGIARRARDAVLDVAGAAATKARRRGLGW
jgi:CubicO group peptidase (beta-lactamase class C family)